MPEPQKSLPPGMRYHRGKIQVRYYGSDRKYHAKSCRNITEAKAFKSRMDADKERREWIDPRLGRQPFKDYAGTWFKTKANAVPRTRINVDGRLRNHILPAFGERAINTIQPSDIRLWVMDLSSRLQPSTVKATYQTMAQIMRTAAIDGVVRRSPCIGVELPPDTSRSEMHFLTPDQVQALADSIDPRFRGAILSAAYTGLRAGELWALRLPRVNLLRRQLEVVESLSEVGGELVTGPTKTKESRRTVTLPAFLVDVLGRHIEAFPSPTGYLFTAPKGGPVRHHNFKTRHFHQAVTRAGLPQGLRFHDLRHTCAAILIAQGWNPAQIQRRLGHSSIRVTMDNYAHLFEGHDAALLESLDDAYKRTETARDADQMRTRHEISAS